MTRRTITAVVVAVAALGLIYPAGVQAESMGEVREAVTAALASWKPAWKVIRCDEKPSVEFDGQPGYRLVLEQITPSIDPRSQRLTNQAAYSPGYRTPEQRDYIDLVLFQQTARLYGPVEPGQLKWSDLKNTHYVKAVDMGTGLGFSWFGRTGIIWQDELREKLKLRGGDDRIALLIAGFKVEDLGNSTANSVPQLIARRGDEAVPYIERALKDKSIRPQGPIHALGLTVGDRATDLLRSLYHSDDKSIAGAVDWALLITPRSKAKEEYLDMLGKQIYVADVSAVCRKLGWQREAIPLLRRAYESPKYWSSFSEAFYAKREFQGHPVAQDLRSAGSLLRSITYAPFTGRKISDTDIEKAKQTILSSPDKEAAAVIAASLAYPVPKGNTQDFERVYKTGREIFANLPKSATDPVVKSLRQMDKETQADLSRVVPEL